MASEIKTNIKVGADAGQAKREMDTLATKIVGLYKELKNINNNKTEIGFKDFDKYEYELTVCQQKVIELSYAMNQVEFNNFSKGLNNTYDELHKIKFETGDVIKAYNSLKAGESITVKLDKNTPITDAQNIKAQIDKTFAEPVVQNININKEQAVDDIKLSQEEMTEALNILADAKKNQEIAEAFDNYFVDKLDTDMSEDSLNRLKDIIVNTYGETDELFSKFEEVFSLISSEGLKSVGSISAVYKALGPIGIALIALKETISAIMSQLDELGEFIGKIGKGLKTLGIESFDFAIDTISDSINFLSDSFKQLQEYSERGADIQGNFYSMYNFLENEAGDAIVDYANSLHELYGINPHSYLDNMEGIYSVAHNVAKSAEEQVQIATTLKNTALDLFAFTGGAYGNVDALANQLESAINLNVLNSKSVIARTLNLTDEMIAEFKDLGSVTERYNWILEKTTGIQGVYTKWLQTEAGQVHLLKENYEMLLGNLGQLALGIYAKIAPVLNVIVELANKVVTSLMSLFNIDLQTSAMINGTDAYSNVSNAMDEVGESAEKAKRKVSSFDDVIQISEDSADSSSNSLSSFGGGLANNDWTDYINNNKSALKEFADEVKALIEDGAYIEAGNKISQGIKTWLQGLDWNTYKAKADDFGRNIGLFINGLTLSEQTFGEIGNAFSQGINTIFTGIKSLGQTINFKDLGISLGTSWKSFWEGLDSDIISDALYEWIMGGFDTVAGLLDTASLSDMTGKIGDIILGFFSNITEKDIVTMANDVIGVIDNVFDAVQTLIDKLKSDKTLKDKIMLLIKNIFTNFKENAEGWGETANELIGGILDFLIEAIDTADSAGLSAGIRKFLSGLNLGELLNKFIGLVIREWWIKKKAEWAVKLNALGGILSEAIKTLGQITLIGMQTALALILALFISVWNEIKAVGSSIAGIWDDTIKPAIDKVCKGISTFFGNIWEKIKGLFSVEKWKKLGADAFNALWNGLKSVFNNIKEWFNKNIVDKLNVGIAVPEWIPVVGGQHIKFNVPRLATGGIVTSSTFANIGEDGAEGVFPLTGAQGQAWMNVLADKIASKLNNSTGGSSITIDMSSYQKNFYTRAEMIEFGKNIVEALKTCGVNLQVAY